MQNPVSKLNIFGSGLVTVKVGCIKNGNLSHCQGSDDLSERSYADILSYSRSIPVY